MRRIFLIIIFSLFSTSALAGITGFNYADDISYRYLDVLNASGLLQHYISTARPLSRLQIASLIEEAQENYQADLDIDTSQGFENTTQRVRHLNHISALLHWFTKEYQIEISALQNGNSALSGARINKPDFVNIRTSFVNQNARAATSPIAGAGINSRVQPLLANEHGRERLDGTTFELEFGTSAQISPFINITARPRLSIIGGRPTNSSPSDPFPSEAYINIGDRYFALTAGRRSVTWGPGINGGLLFSENARALDMINLSNPEMVKIPYLGAFTVNTFVAHMGDASSLANHYVEAARVDWQPIRYISLAAQHAVQIGGQGSISPSAGQATQEFFGKRTGVTSNHMGGFDLTLHGPDVLRGAQIFGELLWENKNSIAWRAGTRLPRLTYDGGWSLAAQFTHVDTGVYRSAQYTSGWALNQFALGQHSGPGSSEALVKITRDLTPGSQMSLETAILRRDANGAPSNEWSSRTIVRLHQKMSKLIALELSSGYEHVNNSQFVSGRTNNNNVLAFGLTISP